VAYLRATEGHAEAGARGEPGSISLRREVSRKCGTRLGGAGGIGGSWSIWPAQLPPSSSPSTRAA